MAVGTQQIKSVWDFERRNQRGVSMTPLQFHLTLFIAFLINGLLALLLLKSFDCETFNCWVPNYKQVLEFKRRKNMIEQAAETAKTNVIFNRLFSKVLSEEDLSDYDLT